MKEVIAKWQTFIDGSDGWTTAFCENHDQGRSVSRFASDAPQWRERSAKMLAMMLCAMTGTLFVYQGQEIGMINAPKDWPIEDYKDIGTTEHALAFMFIREPNSLGSDLRARLLGQKVNFMKRVD